MAIVEKYKLKQLFDINQILLLDRKGYIIESCDGLFATNRLGGDPVFAWMPLIESIFQELLLLNPSSPELRLTKIEKPAPFLPGYYDFTFRCVEENDDSYILWSIQDFTLLYQDFMKYQQHRNEIEIRRQSIEAIGFFRGGNSSSAPSYSFSFAHQYDLKLSYFHVVLDVIGSEVNLLDGLNFSMRGALGTDSEDYLSNMGASLNFLQRIVSEFHEMAEPLKRYWQKGGKQCFQSRKFHQMLLQLAEQLLAGLPFRCKFASRFPEELLGNPIRCCQVLAVLLTNAKKYGQKTAIDITLSAKTENNTHCKVFASIKEHLLSEQKIYLPLGEDSAHFAALVLRLSLVKKIIANYKGKIRANLDNDDDSLNICIELPFELPTSANYQMER